MTDHALTPGLVSVMMPAYNAASYIAEAIESLLAQTYPHWELIIVDDGSRDATAQIAASYRDPRIWLISQDNRGESAARNMALAFMRGEFVAFLDADDAFLPRHLEDTVTFLQAHPELDAVYTDGYHMDGHGERGERLSARRRGPFTGHIFAEVVRASDVFGPPLCVVLRRQPLVERELRFDEEIIIGPDWDFLTRYSEHATFGYLPQATCLYRVHDTNITLRVGGDRRARSLAKVREKAIRLASFNACPEDVRYDVFYDLLVNLLAGQPQRQDAITRWSQFEALKPATQARLLRLMASQDLARGERHGWIPSWLNRARALAPADGRGQLLTALYRLSPDLCEFTVRTRQRFGRRAAWADAPASLRGALDPS
jgi:glycosyltransferase involved in cell wall biosynthesis